MPVAEEVKKSKVATTNPPTQISFLQASSENRSWVPITPNAPAGSTDDVVKKAESDAQAAQKKLSEYLHSVLTTPNLVVLAGSGTSLGKVGGPSMQALWELVIKLPNYAEVAADVRHPADDKWIENLLSRCKAAIGILEDAKSKRVQDFLIAAEKMILTACSGFLAKADLSGHQTFLKRMARRRLRAPRLRLFTTNYDLCFETAAGKLGMTLIDGFSFTYPRRFDPRFFTYDIVKRAKGSDESHNFAEGVIQLLKLHGSVNWDETADGIIQSVSSPSKPCLVYPATAKYEQSYSQPHLELMAQFQWILREPNTCLVTIGFGFNDNHLMAPIMAAVDSNPSFKLLAVDCLAKAKSEQDKQTYKKLAEKIKSGESDITLLNADFSQFSDLIPQLRALSPAEQIELSVKQIARES